MKLWKFCAVAAAATVLAMPVKAELKSISIGTNPSGSTYYLIGSSFAKLFQEELKVRSTAQPFAGSSVYLPSISVGDLTLGMASTVDAGLAYSGEAGFPRPLTNLRAIANVWNIPYAFIARGDSGIEKMEDLKGKRVMGEIPASQALTRIDLALLASGGLSTDDVDFMSSGGLMDGITAVAEGRADAAPVATTMPVLTETHASVRGGLRVVANGSLGTPEFFGDQVSGLSSAMAMPTEKRPYIVGETPIVSYDSMVVGNADLSDDDAYALTKTLYDNWEQLQADIGPLRATAKDALALSNSSIPYHPGSIRFFKEIGIWSEAHEQNQARF
ncbi:TAXI family TRAP transporter solute-binding subunit [Celeribacter sp. ULVN23_4]